MSEEVTVRTRDPKDMVRDVLEAGEELLWYGSPHIEAGAEGRRRGGAAGFFVVLAGVLGLTYYQTQQLGVPVLETIRMILDANPMALYGAGGVMAFVIAARFLGFDGQSRLKRHFAGHAYGLTDRRVIVIEGKAVTTFAGGELDRPIVVERATDTTT